MTRNQLDIRSPKFFDGEAIPREYGYTERNVNPPLEISGVPDRTESLALLVDDPDAEEPAGKVWDHWVVWNIPPDIEEIPEDWSPADAGAVEGANDYGERGYGGPNPPDREHNYRFRLFALDSTLDLPESSTVDDVLRASRERLLSEAELVGAYAP